MTTDILNRPTFYLLMNLNGSVYAPELDEEQITDRDTIIKDIVDGQFMGDFVSLFEIEAGHAWNISAEVLEAMEGDEDEEDLADYSADRIGAHNALGGWV